MSQTETDIRRRDRVPPSGWVRTNFGTLYELIYGKSLPNATRNPDGDYAVYGSNGIVGHHDAFLVEHPVLIVGRKGAVGSVSLSSKPCWPIDTTYFIRDSKYIDIRFSFYLLESLRLNQFDRSTAIPGLNRDDAYNIVVDLPPLPEQHRIVTKIEELFSELDKGIESLKTAQAKLDVYRQAMLKHAFEGKLTAQWREVNKDKLETPEQLLARITQERKTAHREQLEEWKIAVKEWEQNLKKGKKPAKPRTTQKLQPFALEELRKLPEIDSASWKWVKVDQICSHTQYSIKAGPFGSALRKQFYVSDGYKVYGQEQVISGDPDYGNYFIGAVKYEELKTCKIAPKDVLISLVGTVGKVLILPDDCREGIINPRLIKITLNLSYYRPEFFKYFLESAFVRSLYKTLAKGTTMDVLNLGIIQNLPFPLCSLAEQDSIVRLLEERFTTTELQEREIASALNQAEMLRQSILKKAFSGQLVPQNPDDEPASILLERIKDEKPTLSQTNKRKKRRREKATA